MISTPLLNLHSTMQQRSYGGSAAIVALIEFEGAFSGGKAPVIIGKTHTITRLLSDRFTQSEFAQSGFTQSEFTQSGRCRYTLAPT